MPTGLGELSHVKPIEPFVCPKCKMSYLWPAEDPVFVLFHTDLIVVFQIIES